MLVIKRMWIILTIVLVLGLGVGCPLDSTPADTYAGYSYALDELEEGIFYRSSLTMTLNDWFLKVTNPSITYDAWSQREGLMYKDNKMKMPFAGSDIVNENTVIYIDFPINGYGKKIGVLTGTITLNDIPGPAAPKVWIRNYRFANNSPAEWWFAGKVNMSNVDSTTATLNWTIPVYEQYEEGWGFLPNLQSRFSILVLPAGGMKGYEVSIPTPKIIDNANSNVGSLGPVSIKGITLSGTINVTYDGEPVPFVEMSILDGGNALLNTAHFSPSGTSGAP